MVPQELKNRPFWAQNREQKLAIFSTVFWIHWRHLCCDFDEIFRMCIFFKDEQILLIAHPQKIIF